MPEVQITLDQAKRAMWLGMQFSDIVELGLKAAENQMAELLEKALAKKLAAKIETALADGRKRFDVDIEASQGQYLATLSTKVEIDFHQNGFKIFDYDGLAFGLNNRDLSELAMERENLDSIKLYRICDRADELVEW